MKKLTIFYNIQYIVKNIRLVRLIRQKISPKTNHTPDAIYYNSLENVNKVNSNSKHNLKLIALSKDFIIRLLEVIESKYHDLNSKTIIDFGCGPGLLLHEIQQKYQNNILIGLDYSENKISNSRKLFKDITFEVHDIYKTYSKKADLLVCTEVLEHIIDPDIALKNFCANINPKGSIFLSVPNGRLDTFHGHIHFWSPESWNIWLKKHLDSDFIFETGLFNNLKNNYALIRRKE